MVELFINNDRVTTKIIEELIKICPFNAIENKENRLEINSGCKMCKICVKKSNGIIVLKEINSDFNKIDKDLWRGITVYIDYFEGIIHPVSLELIGKAKELAKEINHPVHAVIIGKNIVEIAKEIQYYGVDEIHIYDSAKLEHFDVQNYSNVFEEYIREMKPSSILIGATTLGRSLAPRLAARFRTGLTADCTVLEMKKNTDLVQIRPAFGGNIMAQIITQNHRPQFCTARYKVFNAPNRGEKSGIIINHCVNRNLLSSKIEVLDILKKEKLESISDAEIIIALGRGVQKKEDIEIFKKLGDLIGAQLACTRPLIENGWFDPRKQIGLSGRTVKPKLIIAIGIYGAVQFTAGMENSDLIVAINNDEDAPIFNYAHIGIVGDIYEVIPNFIENIKKEIIL